MQLPGPFPTKLSRSFPCIYVLHRFVRFTHVHCCIYLSLTGCTGSKTQQKSSQLCEAQEIGDHTAVLACVVVGSVHGYELVLVQPGLHECLQVCPHGESALPIL